MKAFKGFLFMLRFMLAVILLIVPVTLIAIFHCIGEACQFLSTGIEHLLLKSFGE